MKKYNVGYCCGVWDLGHSAHIKFLKRAKNLVHYLIVGVVEDAAVKDKKGSLRPILSINDRVEWVKSLELANTIISQKTFSPSSALELYKPDIFIKGKDQTHIDEKKAKELNIPIVYLPRTKGISTSEIIKKVKDKT